MPKPQNRWESSSSDSDSPNGRAVCRKRGRTQAGEDSTAGGGPTKETVAAPLQRAAKSHNPLCDGCRLVYHHYERVDRINEGTYGIVWKAQRLDTKETVALKQIKFDAYQEEGFPRMALREISVLLELSSPEPHSSVVSLHEIVVGNQPHQVFLVRTEEAS
jgi:cell division cycle 2-like